MEKVLITGGLGLIGSSIAKKLLNNGYDVTLLDNYSTNVDSEIEKCKIINADITNLDELKKISITGINTVLHLAGQSSGPKSFNYPELDANINIIGTLNMLRFCSINKVKRFIFASTFTVHGEPEGKEILTEKDNCEPKSIYGVSKLACENYIKILAPKYNIDYNILRMFNVYGPGQDLSRKDQGMVSIFLSYVREGNHVPVMGSLDRFRDLIYIDDVVDGWVACVKDKINVNQTYNLGSGVKSFVGEMINEIIDAEGKTGTVKIEEVGGTPGDLKGCYADITKIKEQLNFKPKTSLKEGLKKFKLWADQKYSKL
jgi:UDP-glucose 4-epimerase